jgi:hypothetical protein
MINLILRLNNKHIKFLLISQVLMIIYKVRVLIKNNIKHINI